MEEEEKERLEKERKEKEKREEREREEAERKRQVAEAEEKESETVRRAAELAQKQRETIEAARYFRTHRFICDDFSLSGVLRKPLKRKRLRKRLPDSPKKRLRRKNGPRKPFARPLLPTPNHRLP